MGQAAHEAALLERGDQPVDAGLRLEVERLLHLVEGGGHARLLQPLMDEHEKLFLLRCEHLVPFERLVLLFDALTIRSPLVQIMNSLSVLFVFCKGECHQMR